MKISDRSTVSHLSVSELQDTRGDGCHLKGDVLFLGVYHHLMLIRVDINGDGCQDVYHEEDQSIYDDIVWLYDFPFQTVQVPGLEGDFITIMHPHGE